MTDSDLAESNLPGEVLLQETSRHSVCDRLLSTIDKSSMCGVRCSALAPARAGSQRRDAAPRGVRAGDRPRGPGPHRLRRDWGPRRGRPRQGRRRHRPGRLTIAMGPLSRSPGGGNAATPRGESSTRPRRVGQPVGGTAIPIHDDPTRPESTRSETITRDLTLPESYRRDPRPWTSSTRPGSIAAPSSRPRSWSGGLASTL